MIDLATENVMPLAQAAKLIPSTRTPGKRLNACTIWRWATRGCKGTKLETLKTPGGLVTSQEAVQRFLEKLTAGEASESRTTKQRQRDIDRAERELSAVGI